MQLISRIPFLVYLLVAYNLFVLFSGRGGLENELFLADLPSGALFVPTVADLLVTLGLLALAVEVLKATRTAPSAIIDHALSTVVLIIFVIEFLVVPSAGTVPFLLLTVMALLDVIAGFTVTITAARRDIAVDRFIGGQ